MHVSLFHRSNGWNKTKQCKNYSYSSTSVTRASCCVLDGQTDAGEMMPIRQSAGKGDNILAQAAVMCSSGRQDHLEKNWKGLVSESKPAIDLSFKYSQGLAGKSSVTAVRPEYLVGCN